MLINIMIFIGALSIGSFLNLIIYRVPRCESLLGPRSHCTLCRHALYPRDLIPVLSFVWLGGRCRYCKQVIKLRYLQVEIITALGYIAIYDKWGVSILSAIGWLFTALLIICAYTDVEEGIIPDLITYPGMVGGLVLSGCSIGIRSSIIGALLLVGLFLLAALLSQGGMGGGDIKLAGVIGAFLGWQGALSTLIISSLTGGIWAAGLLLQGRASRKTEVKFGPFLSSAAWVVWMYGEEISDFYWRVFF
ncbi:MAG: prepilin peptidase [Syntrophomonadaceae bacterium]|nr:prepilin peptidase [Syntrophomonadaceae bacterium]